MPGPRWRASGQLVLATHFSLILRNFESRVKDNKAAANKALTVAGRIEDTIEQAVDKSARVSEQLKVGSYDGDV